MTTSVAMSRDPAPPSGASAFMQREAQAAKWPKRPILLILALAAGVFAAWAAFGGARGPAAATEDAPRTPSPANAVAAVSADADLSAIERRQLAAIAAAEAEERRLQELSAKREALEKEVADLTAPLSPSDVRDDPDATNETAAAEPSTVSEQAEAPAPSAGGETVRVFIYVRTNDPEARRRAQSLTQALRRQGVEVAAIRGVPHAVLRDMVRFFYDGDENAAARLESALKDMDGAAPLTQDFRRKAVAPRRGTLEIWLS
ncbi:hypothetical protein ACFQ4O_04045 [Methylopila musalis]|uniref:SPOR domain-containing protein n=1 Tax=Methylopila musalis TaxID=1134781 RepID=A0ABW3Z4H5_9HYPH